jgi:hypothetical protein
MERLSPHLRRFLACHPIVHEDGVRRRFVHLHCGIFGISSVAHIVDEILTISSFLHTRCEAFPVIRTRTSLRGVGILLECDGMQGQGEDNEAQTKQGDKNLNLYTLSNLLLQSYALLVSVVYVKCIKV